MRAWGIATVSAMSQQTTSELEFKALDRMFFKTLRVGMVRDGIGKSWPWCRWWHPPVMTLHYQRLSCELWLPLCAMTGRNLCEVAGKLRSSTPRPLLKQPWNVTGKQVPTTQGPGPPNQSLETLDSIRDLGLSPKAIPGEWNRYP